MRNLNCWLLAPRFLPQKFGTVCGNDSSQLSMHLHSRLIPRSSASNPLDNKAHTMAGNNQVLDLESLCREMHGIAEQIRIMNENNVHLIQHLAMNNLPPPAIPALEEVYQFRRSRRSGDHES